MLGNIWLSSALIVTAIFSAGAMYKSYSDIQEAKQIQEHYEIISEIKTLLAKQYNKNPDEITRDDIIANLPKGENWEKVLLLDRNKDSNLSNKELVNETGNFEISEDEKLKLLALKAKLKDVIDVTSIEPVDKKYTFEVGKVEKNRVLKDIDIEDSITKAIHFLGTEILYSNKSVSETMDKLLADENKFIPYDKLYFLEDSTDDEKKAYFKSRIKDRLYQNENALETRLYKELKDIL
ncbi:MAG: hypothetical protein AB7D41_03400 [Arcobacter sp.]|uniref:hypothetical protein n=1 Tax=Arcobacter sp. TaxID=1872629 RepID=UPI003D07BE6B